MEIIFDKDRMLFKKICMYFNLHFIVHLQKRKQINNSVDVFEI